MRPLLKNIFKINALVIMFVLAASITATYAFTEIAERVHRYPELFFAVLAGGLVAVLLFWREECALRKHEVIIMRVGATLFLFYELFSLPHTYAYWITENLGFLPFAVKTSAAVLLALSIRFVNITFLGLFASLAAKVYILRELDIGLSKSDFLPVLHFFMFLSIAIFTKSFTTKFFGKIENGKDKSIFQIAIALSIGAHIGNYFWSAMEKLEIYNWSFGWFYQNDTFNIARAAIYSEQSPVYFLLNENAISFINSISFLNIPLNALTLASQLLSVVALTNRKLLIVFTIMFDIFHIGVFALSGIFFYKWIILNFLIIYYLNSTKEWYLEQKMAAIIACLVGLGFHIAQLGWHDSNTFYDRVFVSVNEESQARLAPSMFNFYSLEIAQQRFGETVPNTTNTYGSITLLSNENDFLNSANECNLGAERHQIVDEVVLAFQQQQEEVSAILTEIGWNPAWFPHHIWSPSEIKNINFDLLSSGDLTYQSTMICMKEP